MGDLFAPKSPPIQPPARMPDIDDPAVREAQRKKRMEMAMRGGRSSTFLSDRERTTGDTYSSPKAGVAA